MRSNKNPSTHAERLVFGDRATRFGWSNHLKPHGEQSERQRGHRWPSVFNMSSWRLLILYFWQVIICWSRMVKVDICYELPNSPNMLNFEWLDSEKKMFFLWESTSSSYIYITDSMGWTKGSPKRSHGLSLEFTPAAYFGGKTDEKISSNKSPANVVLSS